MPDWEHPTTLAHGCLQQGVQSTYFARTHESRMQGECHTRCFFQPLISLTQHTKKGISKARKNESSTTITHIQRPYRRRRSLIDSNVPPMVLLPPKLPKRWQRKSTVEDVIPGVIGNSSTETHACLLTSRSVMNYQARDTVCLRSTSL